MLHSLPPTRFDPAKRRQLLDLLSELNPADATTSDNFWLDIFQDFNGTSMKELLQAIVQAKAQHIPERLGLVVQPRSYQLELFAQLLHDQSNYIVFLPTGAGKTLVSYLHMKYMLEQYGDKHVVFLAKSIALAGQQYLSFLKMTQFSQEQTELFYGGKRSKGKSLRHQRVFFMTPVIYQQMLDAGELKLHHCSLLVFDEVHHARKEDPYAVIMRDYVMKELACYQPRVLGMTASPGEGKNVHESIESIDTLCSTMAAKLITPTAPDSVRELNDCTAHQELIIEEYSPSNSDSQAIAVLNLFLRDTAKIVLEFEKQAGLDQNKSVQVQSDDLLLDLDSDDSSSSSSQKQKPRSRSQAIEELSLIWKIFEDKEQNLAAGDGVQFVNALHQSISMTPVGPNKLLLVGLLRIWTAIEEVQDLGLSSLDFADLSNPVSDSTLRACHSSAACHYLMRWNEKKREMSRAMLRAISSDGSGHGKMEPLMNYLRSMGPNSRGIVFVQERATAKKVTAFLQSNLPSSIGAECLVGKADMSSSKQLNAAARFNAGEFNVLVATSVAEEGIDIKSCDLVVRLDGTMTAKALIQSRGRARSHDSRFVLIVAPEERNSLNFQIKKEKFMLAAVRFKVDPKSLKRDGIDLQALFADFTGSAEANVANPDMWNRLHQWHQQHHMPAPLFHIVEAGTTPSPTRFTSTAKFDGKTFSGVGENKKDSKYRCAAAIWNHLTSKRSSPSSSDIRISLEDSNLTGLSASRIGTLSLIQRLQDSRESRKMMRSLGSSSNSSECEGSESSSECDYGRPNDEGFNDYDSIAALQGAASLNLSQSTDSMQSQGSSYSASDPLKNFLLGRSSATAPAASAAASSSSMASSSSCAPLSSSIQISVPMKLIGRVHAEHLNTSNAVGVLQTICQKNALELPIYSDVGQNSYTSTFVCECALFGLKVTGNGTNKKLAKQEAASAMLRLLHSASSL